MHQVEGRVVNVSLDPVGQMRAWIDCPPEGIPEPGRFCLVTVPSDRQAALPLAIFSAESSDSGFLAVGDLPLTWIPGLSIHIRGPFGQGFKVPDSISRLALAACGATVARLMPLAQLAARKGADIAWFTDAPMPAMPAAYELNPLLALPDSLRWADFLAVDIDLAQLSSLRTILGYHERPFEFHLPCLGQALVLAAMPCGGAAACGACATPLRRGWKLACQDGPVFDLEQLAW